jgi:hypothetical protein
VRRSLAGLLFGLAAIVGSLTVSGFWLKVTAFSPARTKSAIGTVLQDTELKNEVARQIALATAPQLPEIQPVDLQARIIQVANNKQGAQLLAQIISDAHAKLIGATDKPVLVTPEQLVQVVRDERAELVPTLNLDVPTLAPLSTMREVLQWLVPIGGGVTAILIVLGVLAHPEKNELFQALAFLFFGLAVLLVIIGYVVPSFVVPAFTDNVWANALPRLARDQLSLLVGLILLLVIAGLACLLGSLSTRRRDRWSQPVRRTPYREERRWS